MDLTRLIAFGASFLLVALSPGLCMTLAMSLGISIGVRRTVDDGRRAERDRSGWHLRSARGAALLLKAPLVFSGFKWVGAAYLLYMGWQTWRSEPLRSEQMASNGRRTRSSLILQGFVTAVANPKAWAFFVALLPPFVDRNRPIAPQLLALLALMLIIEFTCLQIYAHGGRALSDQLHRRGKARWLNYIAGIQMMGVGIWLALS